MEAATCGRLALLVALILLVGCAALVLTPMPNEAAAPIRLPVGVPTETWTLNGGSDTEAVTSTVASQQGQTYYVATDGDDDNPGTQAQPFRTIQKAADTAREPGDTVIIRSGIYSPFRIRYPGAENQPITFRNYPGEKPVIDGQLGSGHGIVLQEYTSHTNPIGWIVIEGLEVSHAAVDGIKGYTIHDVIIRNCEIHHSGMNNFLASGSHHITVDSNLFYESNRDPIGVTGHEIYSSGGNYWTVTNNIFYGGDWYMIQATAKARADTPGFGNITHWTIANNVFAFNTNKPGITVSSYGGGYVDDVEIFNNVFYMNANGGCNGVHVSTEHDDIQNVVIHHNVHYAPGPFIIGQKYEAYDNIDADPQFLATSEHVFDNNDFHLRPISPAIDAGASQSAPSHDFDGNSRPQGTGYDIGAYESPYSARVTDLRVVAAVGDAPSLSVTLHWTAPASAVTYTLRSSNTLLTAANWSHASIVTVPFTASEPGSGEWLTTPVDYTGGTLYLALKSQNSAGVWSELSNNAFWPCLDIYLPLIMKDYVSSSGS